MTDEQRKKIEQAAKNYVETHKDSEVRSMYGHHVRSFKDGYIAALDNLIQEESRNKVIQECIEVVKKRMWMPDYAIEEMESLKSSPPKINS